MNDFDALDSDRVNREFKEKSISLIFMDTIHTYEQLKAEYEIWGPYLKDDCIIMVDDIRFIGDKIRNDDRVKILNDFDALDSERVKREFKEKSISLIFMDTIHTYEQLKAEYEIWGPYLKDDCIIMVDDIRPSMPGRTKWQWHVETPFSQKYDVTEWAHNDTGFGVYVK